MDITQAKSKIDHLADPKIKPIGHLLVDLDLELVACGNDAKVIKSGKEVGQIDYVFKDQETKSILIIEVSTQQDNRSEKINQFFNKWSDEKNSQILTQRFDLPTTYRMHRVYVDLSGKELPNESVEHNLRDGKYNQCLSSYDMSYFLDAFNKVGKWTRSDLLSYLNLRPNNRSTTEKLAVAFYLGDVRAYVYVDIVKELLRYCYIFSKKTRG